MSFVEFAKSYGLIVDYVKADAKWHRVRTLDKPQHKNGAYLFDGTRGLIKNWATMDTVLKWPSDKDIWTSLPPIKVKESDPQKAAELAKDMLERANLSQHPYLAKKGFPKTLGKVLDDELLVPMLDLYSKEVVSLQRIKGDGQKKFLAGGRAKNTCFTINPNARWGLWLCEGYATGLSIHEGLKAAYWDCAVMVCFSAQNLSTIGKQVRGFVFADNDEAGIRAAEESGRKYVVGDGDANDIYQRSLMELRSILLSVRR